MRANSHGIKETFCLGILILLVNCGGGSSDGGGFTTVETIRISISADKTNLQANTFGAPPNPAGSFTNTITVRVIDSDGQLSPQDIAIDLAPNLESGALFRLDGEDEEDEASTLIGSRRLVFTDTTGLVTAHFHASDNPGTVTITVSTTDPTTGETKSASLQVIVGPGVSTGQPAEVAFAIGADPLFITGQGRDDVKAFQIFVLDDAGQPVPDPISPNPGKVNNLRVELLPNRPNGGEKLSTINAAGITEQGEVVHTSTINGAAVLSLFSGTLPGTARIAAITDRADNNVDNGIQEAVTDIDTIPISSGEVVSLTFTGPFPGAVAARQNNLPLGAGDTLFPDGVLQRLITVITADQFGNPPPAGTFVTFRLIDSPLSGYPEEGRGTFAISGNDGNPEEGGNIFTTPPAGSSLAGSAPGCLLVFEGNPPNQEGGRIISGVSGSHLLSVNTAFNENPDTGSTVPYAVGCPPHQGNVENIPGVPVQTDASGVASTRMNYPITQLGRRFKLVAEANGGQAGAVLDAFYLGIPDESFLRLEGQENDLQCAAPIGETEEFPVTVQLLDGGDPPNPLPATTLEIDIQINDPDKFSAAEARVELAKAEARLTSAQDALEAFAGAEGLNLTPVAIGAATPNDCFVIQETTVGDPPVTTQQVIPNPGARPECAILAGLQGDVTEAQAALAEAQAALAEAEAIDALFEPTASFSPDPAITGELGLIDLILSVADLPPNGSVTFFIATVGPEILADTKSVTVSPGPNVGACTAVGGGGGGG